MSFAKRIDDVARELDRLSSDAAGARGERRADIIAQLTSLDRQLTETAIAELSPDRAAQLRSDAAVELAPFLPRMDDAARTKAVDAAFARLAREAFRLPVLHFD
jgi:hypothetical protein